MIFSNLLSWYNKFSSQPHQPFFSSGVIFLVLNLLLLFAYYTNSIVLNMDILDFHAYSMIFVVFSQFFLGFLYVVFPRFLIQAEVNIKQYMTNFWFFFFSSLGIFISIIFNLKIFMLLVLILLLTQVYSFSILFKIYKKSIVTDKKDTKWILIFFSLGLVAHFFYFLSQFDFIYSYKMKYVSIYVGFYLFLFGIIFTISQRMIPFFTSMKTQGYKINKSKDLLILVFSFLVLKLLIFAFLDTKYNLLSDIPLFFIFLRELYKWKLPLFNSVAIMWVLYLSLFWIPFALFLSILESLNALLELGFIFEKVVVHTIAVGYFITILIGFGTRVVLGHSGQTPHANRFTIGLFLALQIAVLFRIFASFTPNLNLDYTLFINISIVLLLLVLSLWAGKYLTILLKGK